ncbi:MAG TPA: DVUA0089 family protein, partial [Chthoniobacterales bacterium]|nr:DVUA0089 family protein [Chthoniobacterales bacterium]
PGFEVSFVNSSGAPINSVTVPAGGQRSFFVRTVGDGRQIAADPACGLQPPPAAPGLPTEPQVPCSEFQFYVTATDSAGDTLRMPFFYRAVRADPNAIPPLAAQLQNISTRLNVQTGDNVGIAGIIITGTEPKRVALRGIGPSLAADNQPLNGRMEDPVLELFDPNGAFITSNNNWKDSQRQQIEESGFAPNDDRESVILRTLAPGNYTAVLSGKDNTTGLGLVEAYDRDATGAGRFANISTRGRVETGDNVLIGGFIAGRQDGPTNVVVRALGPSLASRGVPGPLQDPTVQLVNQNGDVINENDDFATSQQRSEVESRGLAPEDQREAALFQTVQPGNYTAVVRGKVDTTGVGLVEVYNVQ